MKSPRISLRLDNPCSEKWSEMTPNEKGRFCDSCKKSVYDVTSLTDNEMLKLVEEHPQGFCGQFYSNQLNRTLVATQLNGGGSRLNAFVAGIMIAVGAGTASAQSVPHNTVQTQVIDQKNPTGPVCIRDTPKDSVPQSITVIVHGDSLNGVPLRSALVQISGSSNYVYTDSTGKATLTLPAGQNADSIVLNVSHYGYAAVTRVVSASSVNEPFKVVLEEHQYIMYGGAVSIIETIEPVKPKKEKGKK